MNFTQYVHELADGYYGIGEWDEQSAQYTVPLDHETAKITGCHTEFGRRPLGCFRTREAALRRARYLWGELNNG